MLYGRQRKGEIMTQNCLSVFETGRPKLNQPITLKSELYPVAKLKDFRDISSSNLLSLNLLPIIEKLELEGIDYWLGHDGTDYRLNFEGQEEVLENFDEEFVEEGIPIPQTCFQDFEIIRVDFGDKILSISAQQLLTVGWEYDIDFGTNDDRVIVVGINTPIVLLQRSFHGLEGNEQFIIDCRNKLLRVRYSSSLDIGRASAIFEIENRGVFARIERKEIGLLSNDLEFLTFDDNSEFLKIKNSLAHHWSKEVDPWEGTLWY